jgi:uncharacterized membrane protein YccC
LLGHRGLVVSIVLCVVLVAIASSVYLPFRPARAMVWVAVTVALVIWVLGQNFGQVFSGSATDLNTGPLLALFALAYWRRRPPATVTPDVRRRVAVGMA